MQSANKYDKINTQLNDEIKSVTMTTNKTRQEETVQMKTKSKLRWLWHLDKPGQSMQVMQCKKIEDSWSELHKKIIKIHFSIFKVLKQALKCSTAQLEIQFEPIKTAASSTKKKMASSTDENTPWALTSNITPSANLETALHTHTFNNY